MSDVSWVISVGSVLGVLVIAYEVNKQRKRNKSARDVQGIQSVSAVTDEAEMIIPESEEPTRTKAILVYEPIQDDVEDSSAKGLDGEWAVQNELEKLNRNYICYHDVYFRNAQGDLVQVDHLVLSPYALFVIETKNYSGRIYGSEKAPQWTQYLGGKKFKFNNPLHQNFGHVESLRSYVKELPILPIVCFTDKSSLRGGLTAPSVVKLSKLLKVITYYKEMPLTEKEFSEVRASVEGLILNNTDSLRTQHINEVQTKLSGNSQNDKLGNCPKCGNPLVERKGPKGDFIGCSTFPMCWYSKSKEVILT
jgi:hypothetical protein